MTTMVRTLWCVALLMIVSSSSSQALRSCTRMGQAVVPCEDELLLEQRDRFLVTLFGHSCYAIHVASAHALDVYFYDTYDWTKQLGAAKPRALRAISPRSMHTMLGAVADWVETMQVCHHAVDCRVTQTNQSAHALYDLVIAKSSMNMPTSAMRVRLRIETCDTLSTWFYVGLVATAVGGFFTMLFLLCIISEFLLGVRAYSHLRRKLGLRTGHTHQFVELAQCDPHDHSTSEINPIRKKSLALSATADPSEVSEDEDVEDDGAPPLRNHAGATSLRAAREA